VQEQQSLRAVTVAVMLVAALIGLALVSGGRASSTATTTAAGIDLTAVVDSAPTAAGSTATTTATTTPTTATPASTTTRAAESDPGALPQTDEKPVASGATFDAGVQGLWQAIVQDKPDLAMPFFFPKSAYVQVKAIADPATDYQLRLIANYQQDIHTLHAQLGTGAADAQFVGISVPDSQAVLVQPGEESNQLSYWRVYGTNLNYSVDGSASGFPVTSLISWRGEWYVVHLGEIR
jgi:hypothetical protein